MTAHGLRGLAMVCATLAALGVAGCARTVSTSGFKGESQAVAQTVANLQSDVTAANEQKICSDDLASAVVARLNTATGGCKQAVKNQLSEVDSLEVTVSSVIVSANHTTATAKVTSIYAGKTRAGTVSLVKQGGKWKISGVA
jgi:hypothetical protein